MNRLKLLRNNLQLSMKECAAKIGIPYTTYVNYEKGLREPNSEMLVMLSDFFNVSVDYLIGRSESKEKNEPSSIPPGLELLPPMKKIPLLGDIACGEPILAEQNITDYIEIPGHIHADYALTCHGDSMVGAGIHDGDLVYIRQQPTVENGQIAAGLRGQFRPVLDACENLGQSKTPGAQNGSRAGFLVRITGLEPVYAYFMLI